MTTHGSPLFFAATVTESIIVASGRGNIDKLANGRVLHLTPIKQLDGKSIENYQLNVERAMGVDTMKPLIVRSFSQEQQTQG